MTVFSRVDAAVVEAILAGTTRVTRRLEIYESDGVTLWMDSETTPRMISGSVTVDYSRAERRAIDVTLDNSDHALDHDPFGFWYDKILRVYRGIEYVNLKLQPSILIIEEPNNFLAIKPYLKLLGYTDVTVNTSVTQIDELAGYDLIVANSGSGAITKQALLADAYAQGYDIFTTGSGNTSATVPQIISATVSKSNTDEWTLNPVTSDSYLKGKWGSVALTFNTVAGQHVTTLAAGAVPVASWTWSGNAGYTAALTVNSRGSRWFHLQPAPWPSNLPNFRRLITNAVSWLHGYQDLRNYETQVGEFMIDQINEDNFPHVIRVTGRDYAKKLLRTKFSNSLTFSAGLLVDDVVRAVAANGGITKFLPGAEGYVLEKDISFTRTDERWKAISDICTASGIEVFFNPLGQLMTRPFQDPVTSPASLSLATGEPYGNLVSFSKSSNDSRIYNRVIVTGEDAETLGEGIFYQAVAENHEPTSPTRIERLGAIDYFYTSAFFNSNAQCAVTAQNFLRVMALEEFNVEFSSLVFPWIEAGEIAEFDYGGTGVPSRFLMTNFTIPLGLGTMNGTAKRVSIVEPLSVPGDTLSLTEGEVL